MEASKEVRGILKEMYMESYMKPKESLRNLSGHVNEFQPSPNLVKILKSNLAACGETPSFGSALTPISCRHT